MNLPIEDKGATIWVYHCISVLQILSFCSVKFGISGKYSKRMKTYITSNSHLVCFALF